MNNPIRKISQWILLFVALIGVGSLWYYAFLLSTDTLALPFVGQEKQYGSRMVVTVGYPSRLSSVAGGGDMLDKNAITASLRLNNLPYIPTTTGSFILETTLDSIVIIPGDTVKKGDVITLDASLYNEKKITSYRLPKNITLTYDDTPRGLSIDVQWDPKETRFAVEMYGYEWLHTDDIRWYVAYDADSCYQSEGNSFGALPWDSKKYKKVNAHRQSFTKKGQIMQAVYSVDLDPTIPRQCLLAGVSNNIQVVLDRTLTPFVLTGTLTDILSPEYDMKSRIEVSFSSPLFTDSGSLYSPEYIAYRSQQKKNLLARIHISPDIGLTESGIVLTPQKLSIVGDFKEKTSYRVSLDGIEDIYGRTASTQILFTPEKKPFLSLVLNEGKTMFPVDTPIQAKIYSLSTPQEAYTVKLCKIELEDYARMERVITEGKIDATDAVYELLNSDRTTACTKKEVSLTPGASVTTFSVDEMMENNRLTPGLYMLAFRDRDAILPFGRFVSPRVFSVVDEQLTMKVDARGRMQFLVTDIKTGAPKENQKIELIENIGSTTEYSYDPVTNEYKTTYLPLSTRSFASWSTVAVTGRTGLASARFDPDQMSRSPYSLMNEYDYDESSYPSFLGISSGNGSFGYVVSTWNDGITGWNFGLKESDYRWDTRWQYTAYLHTDRKLYLPGETVHIHAIVRENGAALTPPQSGTDFRLRIMDSMGNEVDNTVLKTNEFGTILHDFAIPPTARLGNYSFALEQNSENGGYVDNAWSNFQVEVFKNPTFTTEVTLKSSSIENNYIKNIRKKPNTDVENPWYEFVYTAPVTLEGTVRAHYYNGSQIKNQPFSYRVYRSEYYDSWYWWDCFWGCYYTPPLEFYTEGSGMIDSDGLGYVRIPVEFSSFAEDYIYTLEVTLRDPMTTEEVTTPATLVAKLPAEFKTFVLDQPLRPIIDRRILQVGEKIQANFSFEYQDWDDSLAGRYRYELSSRQYTQKVVDDLRMREVFVPTTEDTIVLSGSIQSQHLELDTGDLLPGEYHLRVIPIVPDGVTPPEESIADTILYIAWWSQQTSWEVRVIPENMISRVGDTVRVFFISPFPDGYLYITREKGGVIDSEYVKIQGTTYIKEYTIDDTFVPNVYIGAVAYPSDTSLQKKRYSVGYSEIITDMKDKKLSVQINTDQPTYKNRDTVKLNLALSSLEGTTLDGEIAVMVVDESLIRLLGNIDLDILPKFYQKFPFTTRTALTAIGMDQNRFLSRKGVSGGSGDKWGGGEEIASRILFKNTVFFSGAIRTDLNGRANVEFELPDNVTDYRIIAIGQTKTARFGVAEKTIPVRRDYTLEAHVPSFAYPGDQFTLDVTAFNATKSITQAHVDLVMGPEGSAFTGTKELIINVENRAGTNFSLEIPPSWSGAISYQITLRDGNTVLDRIEKNIDIRSVPLVESTSREFGSFTGTKELRLSDDGNINLENSSVQIRIAQSFVPFAQEAIKNLLVYPYGCAEQTIWSTLPNLYALRFQGLLGTELDTAQAEKNLSEGVQKLLRMQYNWGWKYWEDDTMPDPRVSPYVLRSLIDMKDLGVDIPEASINAWAQYLADIIEYNSYDLMKDANYQTEIFVALAQAKHPLAATLRDRISPDTLSRHGLIMYAYGLQKIGMTVPDTMWEQIDSKLLSRDNSSYFYWSLRADQAIYAQVLLSAGRSDRAREILDTLLHSLDPASYYTSTQENIQLLRAVLLYAEKFPGEPSEVTLQSLGLRGSGSIDRNHGQKLWTFQRSQFGGNTFSLSTSSATPLLYEIIQTNTPDDITQMPAQATEGIRVNRTIEKVDTTKWVTSNGEFIARTLVESGATLEYGALYQVNLSVDITHQEDKDWSHLILENYLPAGIRAINPIFHTESALLSQSLEDPWAWSYTESRPDRIMVESRYGYGNTTMTYTYFFRPEFRGEYLFPPTTAYFMYQPEIHAITPYLRLQVQ